MRARRSSWRTSLGRRRRSSEGPSRGIGCSRRHNILAPGQQHRLLLILWKLLPQGCSSLCFLSSPGKRAGGMAAHEWSLVLPSWRHHSSTTVANNKKGGCIRTIWQLSAAASTMQRPSSCFMYYDVHARAATRRSTAVCFEQFCPWTGPCWVRFGWSSLPSLSQTKRHIASKAPCSWGATC